MYVSDLGNARIQKWAPGAATGSTVVDGTIAGQGFTAYTIMVENDGDLYISDLATNSIKKWASGATTATVIAGGNGNSSGANQLSFPFGVKIFGGNLYVVDSNNHQYKSLLCNSIMK